MEISILKVFTEDTVANAINNLPTGKVNVSNDIPVFIIRKTIDAYCPNSIHTMNDCFENKFFFLIY